MIWALREIRKFAAELVRRVRERGRSGLVRAVRLAGATVLAFVAAQLLGLTDPPPLVAALTALLVVQATLASTLVNSAQRVLSVVSGVVLAVVFVSVVGLNWWSLGLLVGASIIVGQILRLGPHLMEVPISAMLVLGVGYVAGAESVGAGRAVETLVGAVVGVLINLAVPPAPQTRYAGQAVEKFADEIAGVLEDAARGLAASEVGEAETARWLDDVRRLNRHVPQVDRALAHAEESRRLNLRALGTRRVDGGLRGGLDMLEHSSVSLRTLFRAIHDAAVRRTVDEAPDHSADVRIAVSRLMGEVAAVVRAFGDLIQAETTSSGDEEALLLGEALAQLRLARSEVEELLITDARAQDGLWELDSTILITVDRVLHELGLDEHARQRGPESTRTRRSARETVQRLRRPHRRHDDQTPDPHAEAAPTDPPARTDDRPDPTG